MKEYTVALVGNPNIGKQTIFNSITGRNQQITSWPGESIAKCEGKYLHGELIYHLLDLPNVYAIDGSSKEEEIVRNYICFETASIVMVCDALNFKRNLSLLLQILELTGDVIVYINRLEEAKKHNLFIDCDQLSNLLACPVIAATSHQKEGLLTLIDVLDSQIDTAKRKPRPITYPAPFEEALNFLEPYLSSIAPTANSLRFIALMLIRNEKKFNSLFEEYYGYCINDDEDLTSILLSIRSTLEESQITPDYFKDLIATSRIKEAEDVYHSVTTLSTSKKAKLSRQIRSAFKKQ